MFFERDKISALHSQVACQEEEKEQLTQERDTMAQTLNRQKDDLTELGSKETNFKKFNFLKLISLSSFQLEFSIFSKNF